MAASMGEASVPVLFTTQTPYPLPSQKFMIPSTWKRYQLSQLINKALSLPKPIPFDFLLRGEILRASLREWCAEKGVAEEETLEIEYIQSVMPPERMSNFPHDDWVSSVSCQLQGYFLTASYDGHLRTFDYSKKLVNDSLLHLAPITSLFLVPTPNADPDTCLLATASQDLTAQLTHISLAPDSQQNVVALSTLHLHTGPVSSVSSDTSGSHLLTSSWDQLIGLWDTVTPSNDEVPLDQTATEDRKKRRKVVNESKRPRRKAPLSVFKSHTARVSKVIFGNDPNGKTAYSCGFDSTVRTWDVESGVCTNTINAPEKPMLDLTLTSDGHTVLAASTDRTVSVYDVRNSTTALNVAVASLLHPATPSCLVLAGAAHQIVSGAYDGMVRVWDLRSVKSAMATFKTWDGGKKILSVDWAKGLVGIGGEGGMEIWRLGDGDGDGVRP